jgi:ABC-type branched-subunit amino acid transport system substrate-binding protein
VIGKTLSAYFDKVNAEGGINGRRIRFISYDDAYNPAKTVELVRKLVEQDRVLLMFGSVRRGDERGGAALSELQQGPAAVQRLGPAMWDQPQEFPWTMGWQPNYQTEGRIYAQYLLENHPHGKIAVLYQDDAFGNDALKGLKDGLGTKIPIAALAPYKVTDPSIDPQIARLKASGADIFVNFTTPEICHHRHPSRRRARVETGSTPRGGFQLGRGAEAGWPGECGRRVVGRVLSSNPTIP